MSPARRRVDEASRPRGRARSMHGLLGTLLVALVAGGLGSDARAWEPFESDPELRAEKNLWQSRYRKLLADADALRAKIALETELYADANRRNYRRGKKRHVHRKALEKARAELERVEAELATIEDDGRRAGALPGWFYEVEAEFEDAARRPAIGAGPDEDRDAGRNPLYLEQD